MSPITENIFITNKITKMSGAAAAAHFNSLRPAAKNRCLDRIEAFYHMYGSWFESHAHLLNIPEL